MSREISYDNFGRPLTEVKGFRIVLSNGSIYKHDVIFMSNNGEELVTRTNDGMISVYNMRHVVKYDYYSKE